jgi:hypothetical protein
MNKEKIPRAGYELKQLIAICKKARIKMSSS